MPWWPSYIMEEKYIGLTLAVLSSLGIGTSFMLTKKGLLETERIHNLNPNTSYDGTKSFAYLQTPLWWAGISSLIVGEIANFAAYGFAPAILVTPLGALSVLIGAVLGAFFLGEELGRLGRLGCAICLLGSIVIVLHAPGEEQVDSVETILGYAMRFGFLCYVFIATSISLLMIYVIAPRHGKSNPLIYISVCSLTGSISVMAIKAFSIALKLTLGGNNQFWHASTYAFMLVSVVCILTQMNYLNKALSVFSTSIVNPLYYVCFTTATLSASFVLFQGFGTIDAVNTISLLCGFLIIFAGVYLLNLSRVDPHGHELLRSDREGTGIHGKDGYDMGLDEGIPTDPIVGMVSRASMQARRSIDYSGVRAYHHRRSSSFTFSPGGLRHASGGAGSMNAAEQQGLMHNYDMEMNSPRTQQNTSTNANTNPNPSGAPRPAYQHQDTTFGLEDLVEDPDEFPSNGNAKGKTPPGSRNIEHRKSLGKIDTTGHGRGARPSSPKNPVALKSVRKMSGR